MSEFIGSRISLISKSDIRYVGTLHEINSDNSTVALENVTSFGTEGRKGNPTEDIAGSDQIYEYIVFRGSDVKELSIVEPPGQKPGASGPPQDPAIVGSARPQPSLPQQSPHPARAPQPYPSYGAFPPQNQFQQPQPTRFQQGPGQHGFPGAPGSGVPGYGMNVYGGPPPPNFGPMGYGGPPGPGFGPPPGHFGGPPHQPPGGVIPPGQRPPSHMQGPGTPQPPIGSGKGTPQPTQQAIAQKPPVEMAAGTPIPQNVTAPSHAPTPPVDTKPPLPNASGTAPPTAQPQQQQPPPQKRAASSRVAVPHMPSPKPRNLPGTAAPSATTAPPQQSIQSYADATQAATAAVAAAMAKLGPVQNGENGANVDSVTQKVGEMRFQEGPPARGRGSRGRGPSRGGRRESTQRNVEVPKEDYDFESANAKFNKQDLIKEAIATGSPVTSPPPNEPESNPLDQTPTNGHTESKAEEEVVIPQAPPASRYDRQTSFFDNISSDLKDRADADVQTVDGRQMRREERTKNLETFGQGSVDVGYRGGYRGRGRGRGYGNRGRGGWNNSRGGGYRGRGNSDPPIA
ncbi:hypothetical protein K431DRAFT_283335 [Polychaeton citri CBS 116435]|uniref:TFG box profile domain-containing protein n=1 Tax=Polychaeton citri CBS 116435 TaxID=1314669 RepID=A0A9P4QB59_9PEZI|nr:hypothetical protein K431DRAFT_283335 [Polychaeton citri CBS 116435]